MTINRVYRLAWLMAATAIIGCQISWVFWPSFLSGCVLTVYGFGLACREFYDAWLS